MQFTLLQFHIIVAATSLLTLASSLSPSGWVTPAKSRHHRVVHRSMTEASAATPVVSGLQMTASEEDSKPTTFREAEVLGLRLMQEGQFEEALKAFKDGMKLSGSRPDVIRKQLVSGPSPVGGAIGGFESGNVLLLDEFELQAAHYNMACAHAQLGSVENAVANLKLAFENGFDNFATVRGDPDLKALQGTPEFEELLEEYDRGKGFNPFGIFSKK